MSIIIMEIVLILCLSILLVLIILLSMHLYTYYIHNDNIPQLDSIDKLEVASKCSLGYKMGIAFPRPWDINNLGFLYREDPLMLNLYHKLKYKYGKIAVVDTFVKKLYIILDEDIATKILSSDEKKILPGTIKKLMFGKIMPNNVGVCIGKERSIKRKINDELFGTNQNSPIFTYIPEIIAKNIVHRPKNQKDFNRIAICVISDILLGSSDSKDIYILEKTFDYILKDTDISLFGIMNKFNPDMKPINDYSTYLRTNFKKNSIMESYSKSEESNNQIKYKYLADEIPHWIIPMYGFMGFMIPILLDMILSFEDIHIALLSEIKKPFFDIHSENTFLHYCVIEHLRLFNIINMHPVRETNVDLIIDNYKIKKGSEVLILFSSLLRNPKLFEHPNSFIPQRWSEKTIEEQYIVFGVGAQRCPSIHFTPFIYKNYIFNLLSRFEFKTKYGKYDRDDLPFINAFQLTF